MAKYVRLGYWVAVFPHSTRGGGSSAGNCLLPPKIPRDPEPHVRVPWLPLQAIFIQGEPKKVILDAQCTLPITMSISRSRILRRKKVGSFQINMTRKPFSIWYLSNKKIINVVGDGDDEFPSAWLHKSWGTESPPWLALLHHNQVPDFSNKSLDLVLQIITAGFLQQVSTPFLKKRRLFETNHSFVFQPIYFYNCDWNSYYANRYDDSDSNDYHNYSPKDWSPLGGVAAIIRDRDRKSLSELCQSWPPCQIQWEIAKAILKEEAKLNKLTRSCFFLQLAIFKGILGKHLGYTCC